jgi:hypothetical protein
MSAVKKRHDALEKLVTDLSFAIIAGPGLGEIV